MNKDAYKKLIFEWQKHKHLHVRYKSMIVAGFVLFTVLNGYCFLYAFYAPILFVIFNALVFFRCFYLFAKGDWSDLSEHFGLKCWHCHTIFKNNQVLGFVLEKNICPCCKQPVYKND